MNDTMEHLSQPNYVRYSPEKEKIVFAVQSREID